MPHISPLMPVPRFYKKYWEYKNKTASVNKLSHNSTIQFTMYQTFSPLDVQALRQLYSVNKRNWLLESVISYATDRHLRTQQFTSCKMYNQMPNKIQFLQ